MITIRPAEISDANSIAAVYNHGIAECDSTFEITPPTAAQRAERLACTRYTRLIAVECPEGTFA